jgi:hypothetical protein
MRNPEQSGGRKSRTDGKSVDIDNTPNPALEPLPQGNQGANLVMVRGLPGQATWIRSSPSSSSTRSRPPERLDVFLQRVDLGTVYVAVLDAGPACSG